MIGYRDPMEGTDLGPPDDLDHEPEPPCDFCADEVVTEMAEGPAGIRFKLCVSCAEDAVGVIYDYDENPEAETEAEYFDRALSGIVASHNLMASVVS